jgi:hypothetical protein
MPRSILNFQKLPLLVVSRNNGVCSFARTRPDFVPGIINGGFWFERSCDLIPALAPALFRRLFLCAQVTPEVAATVAAPLAASTAPVDAAVGSVSIS